MIMRAIACSHLFHFRKAHPVPLGSLVLDSHWRWSMSLSASVGTTVRQLSQECSCQQTRTPWNDRTWMNMIETKKYRRVWLTWSQKSSSHPLSAKPLLSKQSAAALNGALGPNVGSNFSTFQDASSWCHPHYMGRHRWCDHIGLV